jgi:hypothetical protein
MDRIPNTRRVYSTFEDYVRAFYPIWFKEQKSGDSENSFGRDLAKYTVQKYFPPRQGSNTSH